MSHEEVVVARLPKCNFCRREADVDGKTVMGPWAYMCPYHFQHLGVGLGLGRGQRLILKES